MKLYAYDRETKELLMELDGVTAWTDTSVTTEGGVYSPLADNLDLSKTADCAATLRAYYRGSNPAPEQRLEDLEALMAELLFGGDGE